jgi:hypothetical protein
MRQSLDHGGHDILAAAFAGRNSVADIEDVFPVLGSEVFVRRFGCESGGKMVSKGLTRTKGSRENQGRCYGWLEVVLPTASSNAFCCARNMAGQGWFDGTIGRWSKLVNVSSEALCERTGERAVTQLDVPMWRRKWASQPLCTRGTAPPLMRRASVPKSSV